MRCVAVPGLPSIINRFGGKRQVSSLEGLGFRGEERRLSKRACFHARLQEAQCGAKMKAPVRALTSVPRQLSLLLAYMVKYSEQSGYECCDLECDPDQLS